MVYKGKFYENGWFGGTSIYGNHHMKHWLGSPPNMQNKQKIWKTYHVFTEVCPGFHLGFKCGVQIGHCQPCRTHAASQVVWASATASAFLPSGEVSKLHWRIQASHEKISCWSDMLKDDTPCLVWWELWTRPYGKTCLKLGPDIQSLYLQFQSWHQFLWFCGLGEQLYCIQHCAMGMMLQLVGHVPSQCKHVSLPTCFMWIPTHRECHIHSSWKLQCHKNPW